MLRGSDWLMLSVVTLHHLVLPLSYLQGVPIQGDLLDGCIDVKNRALYRIRRAMKWSFGTPKWANEPKQAPPPQCPLELRGVFETTERSLRERYHLKGLFENSKADVYWDSIALLDALDSLEAMTTLGGAIRALDVGVDDWHYVFVLEHFLRYAKSEVPRRVDLTGVELDGYALESGLYTSADFARAHVAQVGNKDIRYIIADFMEYDESGFDVVMMFFPYIFQRSLLSGGLPLAALDPQGFWNKAVQAVRPAGLLVVFNHTAREASYVHDLARKSSVETLEEWPMRFPLSHNDETSARRVTVFRAPK